MITLNNLLTTLGNSIKTDITFEEIGDFITLSKEVDTQNITNVVADAWKSDSLLKVSHVSTASGQMFILVPRVGNYSEIYDLAENIFDLDKIKKRQEAIKEEKSKIGIINQSDDEQLAYDIAKLFREKLNIKDVTFIRNSASPLPVEQTTVFDNSDSKKLFTLDEIIKKLPATFSPQKLTTDNLLKYDIVIVLASDLIDVYKYKEDSLEDLQNAEDNQELMTNFQ